MISNQTWGRVLEEYALQSEAMPAESLTTRPLSVEERNESVLYLLEKEFLEFAGATITEGRRNLYRITTEGRLAVASGLTQLVGRKRKIGSVVPSFCQRVAASVPREVFDLAALPVLWDKAKEYLRLNNRLLPNQATPKGGKVRWVHTDPVGDPFNYAIDARRWIPPTPAS